MPRSATLLAAVLAASAAAERPIAPTCSQDGVLLQARAKLRSSPHEGNVRVEHSLLGCFPRASGDADDNESFEDLSCTAAARRNGSQGPCRSGLPFFRLTMHHKQSYLDCFTFCLSKGLDLSALLHSKRAGRPECRCGATEANEAAWHGRAPPRGLLLANDSKVPRDDESCEVLVWRYTGPLEHGAVPTALMQLSVSDEEYIDAIAEGMDPRQIEEEDEPSATPDVSFAPPPPNVSLEYNVSFVPPPGAPLKPNGSFVPPPPDASLKANVSFVPPPPNMSVALLSTRGLCEDLTETGIGNNMQCSQVTAWCGNDDALGLAVRGACPLSCGICSTANGWMPCYPHACGPGGGAWQTKSGNQVVVNYYYENLDSNRQAAFQKAMDEWEAKTCVRFVYSSSTPRMRVTITNYDSCSAGVGYPGSTGTVDLNLGWCNQVSHWGNIAHEIGHVLGMNHEQNRADGPAQTYTPAGYKGAHLTVKWQNIQSAWRPQWEGQKRSYIGSQTANYASYDYGSLMHYALGDSADTTNAAWQSVPGQRSGLSDSDIAQISDMYQCGASTATSPSPSTATSPTPAPSPGPAPNGCVDSTQDPWGQSCSAWQAQGACETSNGIREHCPVSCGQCGGVTGGGGSQCTDVQGQTYGQTCVQWASQGACAKSTIIRGQCPGSCAEVSKTTYGYTCAAWLSYGHCPNSDVLKSECPHLCSQCR